MYKVLIVEDEEMIRIGMRYTIDWVKAECVVVAEAENGREGLKKIEALKPDIVITDINMPIMNGIQMLEKGAKHSDFSSIIVSGYDEFGLAKQAINIGVCEYLIKPLQQDEVLRALDKAKKQVDIEKEYNILKEYSIIDGDIEVLPMQHYKNNYTETRHVQRMIEFIKDNYQRKISMKDLVEELEMSSTYLHERFKDATTYTFNDFLNRYRIQKALNIMKTTENEKIYTIATEVGFSNYQYFINVFKKYVDYTPGYFMEYYREKQSVQQADSS